MSNILNIGVSETFWIAFIKAVILVILLCFMGIVTYRLTQLTPRRKKWKRTIKTDIVLGVITIVYVFFAYFAFGPGKETKGVDVEDLGTTKLMEKKPTEKSIEDIQREAYEKKPEQLKRQDDSSFAKEKEEADAQVDKILERAKKRQKGE